MPTSPSQRAATRRYNAKTYKTLALTLRPEEIEAIKEAAAASGKSIARYVVDCCTKKQQKKTLDKDYQR